MNVTVEKIDDINLIISGIIDNNMTEEKFAKLKEEAEKEAKESSETVSDEKIRQKAESEVLTEFIESGLKEANIDLEEILGQPGFNKYEKRDNGLYLEISVSTNPEIDTSVDYTDIIPTFTVPDADPKEVEERLHQMAVQQAPFTPIETPRAVEDGDVTVIDFEGFVDGVAFEGGSAEKFNLKIGSNAFIPGFEAQMIGMEYGEERTITVTFPEEYQSKELAGKEAQFKVKLHEIQEQKAIEPDDAFAQRILNDEKATLETLKKKLADQIMSQALSQFYNDQLKPLLIKGLLTKFDFTLPRNIVEQEIDAKVTESIQQMSEEERKALSENREKFHALRESLRAEARDTIKTALIVDALAKKEGLEADDQEILSALYYQAMMSGQDAQELVNYYKENNLMTAAKMGLTQDKLFGKMLGLDKR
ncbi:MAG TPA: trigger factor [Sulfurovum sp.]|uniref:trigger factor n=1 Tax=Sulfurovum sp. TaxID=1969726 RepID=UPI002F93EFC1